MKAALYLLVMIILTSCSNIDQTNDRHLLATNTNQIPAVTRTNTRVIISETTYDKQFQSTKSPTCAKETIFTQIPSPTRLDDLGVKRVGSGWEIFVIDYDTGSSPKEDNYIPFTVLVNFKNIDIKRNNPIIYKEKSIIIDNKGREFQSNGMMSITDEYLPNPIRSDTSDFAITIYFFYQIVKEFPIDYVSYQYDNIAPIRIFVNFR